MWASSSSSAQSTSQTANPIDQYPAHYILLQTDGYYILCTLTNLCCLTHSLARALVVLHFGTATGLAAFMRGQLTHSEPLSHGIEYIVQFKFININCSLLHMREISNCESFVDATAHFKLKPPPTIDDKIIFLCVIKQNHSHM